MEIIDPKPSAGGTSPQEGRTSVPPQKPDNFLVWAILSTVLCCLPFGVAAIIYAAQVDSFWAGGNYEAAMHAAKQARTWTWVSVGVAAGAWILYLLIIGTAVSLPLFMS